MAERINERLAAIAATRVTKLELGDEEEGARPFTPTDHSLTARPLLPHMNLFPYEIDRMMVECAEVREKHSEVCKQRLFYLFFF